MTNTKGRINYSNKAKIYADWIFEDDNDADPYKRFFTLVNDHFNQENIQLHKSDFYLMALRALRGSMRLKKKEQTKC